MNYVLYCCIVVGLVGDFYQAGQAACLAFPWLLTTQTPGLEQRQLPFEYNDTEALNVELEAKCDLIAALFNPSIIRSLMPTDRVKVYVPTKMCPCTLFPGHCC